MPIDAQSHFSGKRRVERHPLDIPVELRGGGIVLNGRTIDISTQGVGVRLPDQALATLHATDAVSTMNLLQRHFTSGFEVRFPTTSEGGQASAEVRVFCLLVRMGVPPRPGGDIMLGGKFTRTLTVAEWAAISGTPEKKEAGPLLDVMPGPRIQLLVFDPTTGQGGGPLLLFEVIRAADGVVEGVVRSARPMTAAEVRTTLERGKMPARMTSMDGIAWNGTMRASDARMEGGGDVVVRFEDLSSWPAGFSRRLSGYTGRK